MFSIACQNVGHKFPYESSELEKPVAFKDDFLIFSLNLVNKRFNRIKLTVIFV